MRGLTKIEPRQDMLRIGSRYGGWWVPAAMLDSGSICYLAGVGEDTTLDLGLIEAFGCHVWAMDPTPRAIEHASSIEEPRFHFEPVGLWREDADLQFFSPRDPSHVSHSATNVQRTVQSFTAPCQTVRSFMADRGHTRLDLLKLDIEGAEVAVIDDIIDHGPLPAILCVEFDATEWPHRTLRRLARLRSHGYSCCMVEDRNYTLALDE